MVSVVLVVVELREYVELELCCVVDGATVKVSKISHWHNIEQTSSRGGG